ncbi:hypothetical protein GGH99_001961 [Coemansia sp. RSA 1285]|nr:hypothetical protein GGH99_001961 [Coemansia sp. RSA 1285]
MIRLASLRNARRIAVSAGVCRNCRPTQHAVWLDMIRHYTTEPEKQQSSAQSATDPEKKGQKRTKALSAEDLIIKPISPAIQSTIAKIESTNKEIDIFKEIDKFRFTAKDIYVTLPEHLASNRTPGLLVGAADMGTAGKDEILHHMHIIRMKRAAGLTSAFKVSQLKEYLRHHKSMTYGNKSMLVDRIIQQVWRITTDTVNSWYEEAHRKTEMEGMAMDINESVLIELDMVDGSIIRSLEKDHNVKMKVDKEKMRIEVCGKRVDARAAMSNLREILTATTTMTVDPSAYGTPRRLTREHVDRIVEKIKKLDARKIHCNIVHNEGELFVNSGHILDVRDTSDALIQALIEPLDSTAFVVVPEEREKTMCTLAPAADLFSLRPTAVAGMKFFASRSHGNLGYDDAYTGNAVFVKKPLDKLVPSSHASLDDSLAAWAREQLDTLGGSDGAVISAKMGNVLVDIDEWNSGLHKRFRGASDLVDELNKWAPMFSFATHTSLLDWFRYIHDPSILEPSTRELVLTFGRIKEPAPGSELERKIEHNNAPPIYQSGTITARIKIRNGKMMFRHAVLEHDQRRPTADIAFLQARHDIQVSMRRPKPVATTREIIDSLKELSKKLGFSGDKNYKKQPRRHHIVHLSNEKYGLLGADMVGTKPSRLINEYLLHERQVWNLIDDLHYNEVEVLPLQKLGGGSDISKSETRTVERLLGSDAEWKEFSRFLFEMAYGQRQQTARRVDKLKELFL